MRASSSARTTCLPNSLSPSWEHFPLPMEFRPFHVSVTIFTPSAASSSTIPKSSPMSEPFSIVSMAAVLPEARTFPTRRASRTCSTMSEWHATWPENQSRARR